MTSNTTDTLFAQIIEAFNNDAKIQPARMFGSSGLKVGGKVFAMMVKGDLVVKLPRERVDALVGAKLGKYFDPGHGRLMKEWVAIKPKAHAEWLKLAKEALQFVVTGL
ncbi:MAG: hypothetical protein HY066_13185 [Betaproteobacteria bacterium]|nr:hypothetical protein [Betaproteobacteria bacterium]